MIVEVIGTLAAIALVFVPLELLLPGRKPPAFRAARYRVDLLHAIVGGMLIRASIVAVIAALALYLPSGLLAQAMRTQPLWLQFAELLIVSDLAFWVAHRVFHAVPMLWRFHRIHHSSGHLDWLAAFRVHPLDQIVNSTIIALPAVVIGFSPSALAIYALLYRWHAILLHSNVKAPFGPLRWILCTPAFHHWHHADQPEAYDRNFGGQLIVWDLLFGTANLARHQPARYGVDNPPPESFAAQLLGPFLPEPRRSPAAPAIRRA